MPASQFLRGPFGSAARLYDRDIIGLEIARENEDDFIKNLVTILGEIRSALVVSRPAGS